MNKNILYIAIIALLVALVFSLFELNKENYKIDNLESASIITANENELYKIQFSQEGYALEQAKIYKGEGNYPITVNNDINKDIQNLIDTSFSDFVTSANDSADYLVHLDADAKYYLDITYDQYSYSEDIISYVFYINSYTGGAHGMQNIATKVYNLNTAKIYNITDVIADPEVNMPKLQTIIKAKLMQSDCLNNAEDMIDDGLTLDNNYANYESFVLEDSYLAFIFPQYQVGAYACGAQNVSIELSEINDLLTPEFKK